MPLNPCVRAGQRVKVRLILQEGEAIPDELIAAEDEDQREKLVVEATAAFEVPATLAITGHPMKVNYGDRMFTAEFPPLEVYDE